MGVIFSWLGVGGGGVSLFWLGVGRYDLFLAGCGCLLTFFLGRGWVGVDESMFYNCPIYIIIAQTFVQHFCLTESLVKVFFPDSLSHKYEIKRFHLSFFT